MEPRKMDAASVPAYIADASAIVANRVTGAGVAGISWGFITSQQGALVIGVIAAIVGMIWGSVAGVQRTMEHHRRMKILALELEQAQRERE